MYQMHGFTCGIDDLLLLQPYDNRRKQQLDICLNSGEEVHQQFVGREKEHLGTIYGSYAISFASVFCTTDERSMCKHYASVFSL